jgi:hypothetical protein
MQNRRSTKPSKLFFSGFNVSAVALQQPVISDIRLFRHLFDLLRDQFRSSIEVYLGQSNHPLEFQPFDALFDRVLWRLQLSYSHGTAPLTFRPASSIVAAAQHYLSYDDSNIVAAASARVVGPSPRFAPPSSSQSRSIAAPVQSSASPSGSTRSGSAAVICFNCLGVGQTQQACPDIRVVGCHRCLQPGHVSRECTAPRPILIEANSVTPVRRSAQSHLASEDPDFSLDSDNVVLAAREQAISTNYSGLRPPLPPVAVVLFIYLFIIYLFIFNRQVYCHTMGTSLSYESGLPLGPASLDFTI